MSERKVNTNISPTDLPILAGLPWFNRTELLLFMEKTGQVEREDISDKPYVKRGIQLEPIILDEYRAMTQANLDTEHKRMWIRHPENSWFLGRLDARILDPVNGKLGFVEAKTTNSWGDEWGTPHTDDIPLGYMLQVMGYLTAGEEGGPDPLDFCHLLALNPSSWEYRLYLIERDPDMCRDILEVSTAWRQKHLIEQVEPEAKLPEDMPLIFGTANDDEIRMATEDEIRLIQQMKEVKGDLKSLEDEYGKLKIQLQTTMGTASMLLGPEKTKVVTWKNQSRRAVDQTRLKKERPDIAKDFEKVSEFRVMRIA